MTKWNERDDPALDGIVTTCAAFRQACGDPVMAGMISLVYDEERGGLPQSIQRRKGLEARPTGWPKVRPEGQTPMSQLLSAS